MRAKKRKKSIYFLEREERERGSGWCMLSFTETKMLKFCPQFSPTISRQVLFCLLSFSFLLFFLCSSSLSLFFSLLFSQCPFSSHSLSLSKKTLSLFNYLSLSLSLSVPFFNISLSLSSVMALTIT